MPAIPGTPEATAGTQRRPTAAITSATADSTATSETIGSSAGMLAMAEMLAAVGTPAKKRKQISLASKFFNQ